MPSSRFLPGLRARDRPSPESFTVFHPKSREEIVSTGSSTRCGSGAGSRGRGRDGDGERIISALLAAKAEASSRKAEAEREAERILVELSSKDSSSGARTTKSPKPKSREVITRGSSDSFHSGSGGARMIQIHNPREVNSKSSSDSIHTGSGGARTTRIPKRREVISKGSSGSIHSGSGGARMMQIHNPREVNSKGSSSSIHSGSGGARMMKGSSGSIHSGSGDGSRGRGLDGHEDQIMATLLAAKAEASSRKAEAEREAERMLVGLSRKDTSSVAKTVQTPKSREVNSKGSSGSIHRGSGGARMMQIHNPREVNSNGSSDSFHSGSGGVRTTQIPKRREVNSKGSSGSFHSGSGGARTAQIPKRRDVISKGSSGSIHSGSEGASMMKIHSHREVNLKGSSDSIHSGSRDGIRRRGCDEDDDRIISALLIAKAEASSKKAEAERMLVGLMCRDKKRTLKRADAARAKREGAENVAHKFATPPPLRISLQGSEEREQPEAYGRSLKPSVQRNVRFSKTDTRLVFDDNSENIGVRANQHTFVTTLAPTPSVASSIESNSSRASRLSSRPMPKILRQSSKNIIEETSRFKSPPLFPKVFGELSTRRFDSNYSNESALFSVAIGERSTRLTNDLIVSNSESLAGSTSDTCDDYGSVASNFVSSSTSEESEFAGGHHWFFNFLDLKNMFNCASSVYPEPIDDLPTGDSFVTECTEHTKETQNTELTECTERAVYPLCFI